VHGVSQCLDQCRAGVCRDLGVELFILLGHQ
jgi:hypothetical protein